MDELSKNEKSSFTREQALKFTNDAKIAFNWLSKNWDKAIQGKVWLALDYDSFTEWFSNEGLSSYKLDGVVISKAIEQMKEDNPDISVRGMAEVLDVSKSTIDRKSVPNGTVQIKNSVEINSPNLSDKSEAEVVSINNKYERKISAKRIATDLNKFSNSLSEKAGRMKGNIKEKEELRISIEALKNLLIDIDKEL